MKVSKAKKEADEAKSKLSKCQADHEIQMKSAKEIRANLEKENQTLQNQVAELQNSLGQVDQLKADAVHQAREEEKKGAEDRILELESKHENELKEDKLQGWDDAFSAAANEMVKIKDLLYKTDYKFGLTTTGVAEGDALFNKVVLCPPSLLAGA